MQTFLPYPDLRTSSQLLDSARLGKQRVETFQILRALTWPAYAWKNHPAVRMWRGFVPALVAYGVENCREWVRRGNADTVQPQLLDWSAGAVPVDPPLPPWWGLVDLHRSHRSALLRKDPDYYRPLFGPDEPDDLPYLWPGTVFPRWPVRRGGRDLDLDDAAAMLGLEKPTDGQRRAVAALQEGRDCLLVARPGTGGRTAGLLAGLVLPGTTRWVAPPDGPVSYDVPPVPLVAPRAVPAETGPTDRPPPLARPPAPLDRAAMTAEAAEPEHSFGAAVTPLPPGCSLVVLAGADRLAAQVPPGAPPVLAVVPRADAAARAALSRRLGLRAPVQVGAGWDLAGTWLGTATAGTAVARRRALARQLRLLGPALVATRDRDRLDATVAALTREGLRTAGWDPGMRAQRAAAAIGAWRTRRLDALVVTGSELARGAVPLGRAQVPLLLAADPPPDREAWYALIEPIRPAYAVVVLGPDAPADLAALAQGGCRREALLEPYGEDVEVPCGRCELCAPLPAAVTPATAQPRQGQRPGR